jgi:hypothetical protein
VRLTTARSLPDEDEESVASGPEARSEGAQGRWRSKVPTENGKLAELRAADWSRNGEAS